MKHRNYAIAGVALGATLLGGGALTASAQSYHASGPSAHFGILSLLQSGKDTVTGALGLEDQGQPGVIDDGKQLLPQAKISLDDAIAAAQASAPDGALGEIDLEYYNGHLVFNVDMGGSDVKVDASNGAILGQESDD